MLDSIELFTGLTNKELQQVEEIAQRVSYKRGEIVFSQGDFARDLFVIESGQVEITVRDILQTNKQVAVLKNGEFFGEMAIFDKNSIRSATAKTLQNTVLVVIPGLEFERLLQEKPSISFKLLGSLSRRLKETTTKSVMSPEVAKPIDGKVISIASARNGFGKTTFATTLAHLLSQELPRRVLFLDLDLPFADGTFVMGVVSPRSICELSKAMLTGNTSRNDFLTYLVKHSDSLYTLPAPNNLLDGERVNSVDLMSILKGARQWFDYIIVDTDSVVSDLFLNVIDLSDHVFFLAEIKDLIHLKSSARYFQGLAKMNYPENRITILASKIGDDFDLEKVGKLFKYRMRGGVPYTAPIPREFGKTLYQTAPQGVYCATLRLLAKVIFKESFQEKKDEKPQGSFLYRLFFDEAAVSPSQKVSLGRVPMDTDFEMVEDLSIPEENLSVLLKYIRTNMIYGNIEEAKFQTLKLLELCSKSNVLYQILGEIFMLEKNYSQAIDSFKQALEMDPVNHIALGFLAQITSDEKAFLKAVALLKEKIDKNPRYPDLHSDMGKLMQRAEKNEEALTHFKTSLDINPGYMEARMNLAVVLGDMERFDEGISLLMATNPKNIRVYYLLGKFFFATGFFFEALTAFSLAADINGNYYDVGQRLAQIRDYFKRLTGVLDMHRELLRSQPKYPDLHHKVGNLLMLLGKRKEAVASFKKALRLNTNYARAEKALDRLKNMPNYFLSLNPEVIGKKGGHRNQAERISILLEFDKALLDAEKGILQSPFLVKVKNVRTGKKLALENQPEAIADGELTVDCSQLGIVAAYDILLVVITDLRSENSIVSLPHSISESEVIAECISVKVSPAFRKLLPDSKSSAPVRYFFVSLRSQALADAISGEDSTYKAIVANPETGVTGKGFTNSESPGEISFVLSSKNNRDVVRLNDKLKLKIIDQKDLEIFSMDFIVDNDSLESFSKSIILDEPSTTETSPPN